MLMGSVETKLSCFFDPDFVGHGKTLITTANDPEGMIGPMPVTVMDARELQRDASSYASFFDKYGFVLLPHKTAVRDWEGDDYGRYYPDELAKLIHEDLLPGRSVELEPPAQAMLRGPGTANPFYAQTVHADYGMTPEDYVENLTAWTNEELGNWWRHNFEKDQVTGCMMINFWRSVSQTPIRHMPLCVLDPNSVEPDDILKTGLSDYAPTNGKITNQLSLRYNPSQRWYYYPEMTDEEVLVFKVFHYFKAAPNEGLRVCYHTAFEDPDTPVDAEHRKSCEQRVFVYLHD
jgi:hypothetical protein